MLITPLMMMRGMMRHHSSRTAKSRQTSGTHIATSTAGTTTACADMRNSSPACIIGITDVSTRLEKEGDNSF